MPVDLPWEATGYWQDINPGTTRLIVPVLNTLNRSALALSFKHYFSAYTSAGGVQLKIQSSTNGVTWTDELWSTTQTGSDIGPATINTYITHNLNSGSTFIAFVMTGDLNAMNWWAIDDVSITVPSSSFPFNESFDAGPELPAFWATQCEGEGVVNTWGARYSTDAGGSPWEATGYWQDINPGTTRLVVPVLNTIGRSVLTLSFKHYFSAYTSAGGVQLKIQSSTNGVTWTDELWSTTQTGSDIGPETIYTYITHNLNSGSTFIAFVMMGDLNAMNWWALDDIAITGEPSSPKRVDFDGDGQEDILWRYQGAGAYQGLNVIWLMNQSGTASPVPISASPSAKELPSVVEGTKPFMGQAKLQGLGSMGKAGIPGKHQVGVGGELRRGPKAIADHEGPAGAKGRPCLHERETVGNGGPISIIRRRTRRRRSTLSSGGVNIAALQTETELVFSQISDLGWEIAGAGDFDGDGDTDILWRNYGSGAYQGLNVIWYMTGATKDSEVVFSQISDTNWRIVGTGDFDGDSDTDILWRYQGSGAYQGLNVIWYMNGTSYTETVFSQVLDTNWQIVGAGDFDGDSDMDILWRYQGGGTYQGLNVIWYMTGATKDTEVVFSQILDTNWQIGGTGDFDGDGDTDILWRYYGPGAYQGLNVIWYMSGATKDSEEVFSQISDINWRICQSLRGIRLSSRCRDACILAAADSLSERRPR